MCRPEIEYIASLEPYTATDIIGQPPRFTLCCFEQRLRDVDTCHVVSEAGESHRLCALATARVQHRKLRRMPR